MAKLDFLRDHSDIFLRMLNEMRRRLKEIQPETLTSQNYRYVSILHYNILIGGLYFIM